MNDESLSKIVYDAIKNRVTISFHDFSEATKDWEYIPVMRNSELVGVVMKNRNQFHVVAIRQGYWASRKLFRETLCKAIEEYGCAIAMVMNDHAQGHALAKRLGFVEQEVQGPVTIYRITEVHHA